MTDATRQTPAPSNTVGKVASDDYAESVNTEVSDLSIKEMCFVDNIGGTANAITGNARNSPLKAYGQGNGWWLKPIATNTGTVTINIDSLGTRSILDAAGNALSGGELVSGQIAILVDDGAALRLILSASQQSTAAYRAPDCIFQDQKTQGTTGGLYTTGSSIKRLLNTTVRNVLSGASLNISTGDFTLPAGTYFIEFSTTSCNGNGVQGWIRNETDSTDVSNGRSLSGFNGSATANVALSGRAFISIPAAKTFSIRMQAAATDTNGLGRPGGFGTEVYTSVSIWQVGAGVSTFTDTVAWDNSSSSDVNDLGTSQIPGYATAKQIEVNCTAVGGFNLNGLSGGIDQRVETFIHTGTTAFIFKSQAAGSSAANRIGSADFTLNPGECVSYVYSGNKSRWYRIQ